MNKLTMLTADGTNANVEKLAALFPNCVTEVRGADGELKHVVDFDRLRQELQSSVVEGNEERYQFTWPDKRKAQLTANAPITATLRPCREESVDFDNTHNLYIEGDNLDVLKCLKETYSGKVKMIYIDPPYNTGNDFVYKDKFAESSKEYFANSGQFNEAGEQISNNLESDGRFHTNWLNMMYPRLKVARDLLSDNGVILISIDDSELHHLRNICDEIYGQSNFIACCVRKRRDSQANLSKNISPIHEYVIIYAKNNGDVLNKVAANINEKDFKNPDNDPRGPYVTMPCTNKGGAVYTVTTPNGGTITEEWRFKRETYDQLLADDRLVFPRGGDGKPRYKLFLSEKRAEGQLANTWLSELASNQTATKEIKDLFGDQVVFDTPKPVGLLSFCVELASGENDIVLDFFSGSAATAHAVMKVNAESGSHRKFIMVQLPELVKDSSIPFKAGFENICEIGKERIRRAGKKIKEEYPEAKDLDTGFRVLKLDSTNMQDVFYAPADLKQADLFGQADNVKADRTPEDLLFQVMLELGAELDCKIVRTSVAGTDIYNVSDNYLVACFAEKVNSDVITAIAKMKPQYAVFRDSSIADDSTATNFEQLFHAYSPNTTTRVI